MLVEYMQYAKGQRNKKSVYVIESVIRKHLRRYLNFLHQTGIEAWIQARIVGEKSAEV